MPRRGSCLLCFAVASPRYLTREPIRAAAHRDPRRRVGAVAAAFALTRRQPQSLRRHDVSDGGVSAARARAAETRCGRNASRSMAGSSTTTRSRYGRCKELGTRTRGGLHRSGFRRARGRAQGEWIHFRYRTASPTVCPHDEYAAVLKFIFDDWDLNSRSPGRSRPGSGVDLLHLRD
jgi:hypothetical protein